MLKKIQSISGDQKNKILLDLLPNLSYDQFKSILELNIKVFNQKTIYPLLLKSYNEIWYNHAKKINRLNHRELYLSFLEIENDDLYDILEEAFAGNYEGLSKLQHYSQVKMLFPSVDYISKLPIDMFLEVAKNMYHYDVERLCSTNTSFYELCSQDGWLRLLIIKYPNVEWNNTISQDAKDVHLKMEDIDVEMDNNIELSGSFGINAGMGYLDVIRYLMSLDRSYGVDPADYNNDVIISASENGHLEVVEYLMSLPDSYGIDPSASNNEAIRLARDNDHQDVVDYLLSLPEKYGIDPNVLKR